MNKEQIINEAYENYCKHFMDEYLEKNELGESYRNSLRPYPIEEFINKCKTDSEFSENWGLKIEERELSLEERHQLALPIWKEKYGPLAGMMVLTNVDNTPYKIPRKIITITYNNKTIESYE